MSKKLTPWFPGDVKPARKGVYETDAEISDREPCYQFWDGSRWGACGFSPRYCKQPGDWVSRHQSPKWRGRAKP